MNSPLCGTCFPAHNFPVPRKELSTFLVPPGHLRDPLASLHHTPGSNSESRGLDWGLSAATSAPQSSLLINGANGDAYLGTTAWLATSCEEELGSPGTSPQGLGEESWLRSFLSLQTPPGTVWNFYFLVFVCKGDVRASLGNFHSTRRKGGGLHRCFQERREGTLGAPARLSLEEGQMCLFCRRTEGKGCGSMTERLLSTYWCISCHKHTLTY